jgi:hypothetical protein
MSQGLPARPWSAAARDLQAPPLCEFQVNSDTTGYPLQPSVASDASGAFVVVWTGQSEGDPYGAIVGRRFDSEGVLQGDEFQVNTYTPNFQRFPSVASDAAGNFVVVWRGEGQGDGQGDGQGIFGQRYDSTGTALGSEFRTPPTRREHRRPPTLGQPRAGVS